MIYRNLLRFSRSIKPIVMKRVPLILNSNINDNLINLNFEVLNKRGLFDWVGKVFKNKVKEVKKEENEKVEVKENFQQLKPKISEDKVEAVHLKPKTEINQESIIKKESVYDLSDEYNSLTWYRTKMESLEPYEPINEKQDVENELNSKIRYRVICPDRTKGLDVIQSMIDSPFQANDPFVEIRDQFKLNNQRVLFRYNSTNQLHHYTKSPLTFSGQEPTKLLQCDVNLPNLDLNLPISISFDDHSWYDWVKSDDGFDRYLVVIDSFENAISFKEIINAQDPILLNQVIAIIDPTNPWLGSAISTYLQHAVPNLAIYSINSAQALKAVDLLKKNPNQVTPYHTLWLDSNLSSVRTKLFNSQLTQLELRAEKEILYKNYLQVQISNHIRNLNKEIQLSENVLTLCLKIKEDFMRTRAELLHEFEGLDLVKDDLNWVDSIKRQKIELKNLPLIPDYARALKALMEGNVQRDNYKVIKLMAKHDYILQSSWDTSLKKLNEAIGTRPTLNTPHIDVNNISINANNPIQSYLASTELLNLIINIQQRQEDIITQYFTSSLATLIISIPMMTSFSNPSLTALPVGIALYLSYKALTQWNRLGDIISQELNQSHTSVTNQLVTDREELIDKVEKELIEIIHNQIQPYHQEVINKATSLITKYENFKLNL